MIPRYGPCLQEEMGDSETRTASENGEAPQDAAPPAVQEAEMAAQDQEVSPQEQVRQNEEEEVFEDASEDGEILLRRRRREDSPRH